MVCNSADHGIEATDARLAAGKSAEARSPSRPFSAAAATIIQVSDDGNGLDRERILRKGMGGASSTRPRLRKCRISRFSS